MNSEVSEARMWMILYSPSLLSVFIGSVVLLIIVYVFLRLCDAMQDHSTTAGKFSRRLGFFEKFFFTSAKVNNTGYINTVLFLESEGWLQVFEKQINGKPFDTDRGPLWRAAMLRVACSRLSVVGGERKMRAKGKTRGRLFSSLARFFRSPLATESLEQAMLRETSQSFDHSGSVFKNTLLFTFHHVICDALSIFEFKKKLVEFLGLLYNDEPIEVESLPFRPSLESAMQHIPLGSPGVFERLSINAFFALRKLKTTFCNPEPKNLYLSTFLPQISHSVPRTTNVIPRSLTKKETMALIKCSKANKCTVHGALTAAIHLAMSQLLKKRNNDLQSPLLIDSTYTVNVRKECEPRIGSSEFGLFVTFDSLQIMVRSASLATESFWEFARSCTSEVHGRIRNSGSHRNVLKLFQCVNAETFCALSRYDADHGLHREVFNLTNLGYLSIDQDGKSPYKFAGSHLAVQCAKINYVIGRNIFTINDRLYWTGEYSPQITSRSQAEDFVDLSLRILADACA